MSRQNPLFQAEYQPILKETPQHDGITMLWSPSPSLEKFSPINLEELGVAALLNRVETKYIFHQDQLDQVLSCLQDQYRILEINHLRANQYQTLYFDTVDFHFYQRHQAGAQQRWKVRSRTYLDSERTFLEVKYKNNKKRTHKQRIPANSLLDMLHPSSDPFLLANAPCRRADLQPSLETTYTRSTLVNLNGQERVTIDLNLQFANGISSIDLSGLVIVEVKQAHFMPQSLFMKKLIKSGIRPTRFSKYCIGTALLNPWIKQNRFKSILLTINKLLSGGNTDEWIN